MPPVNPSDFTGPIVVSLAYVALYYGLLVHLLRVKNSLAREYAERGEKFDRYFGQDRRMLAADRMQLNTLEHMPPFMLLLWLNAVFVDVGATTIAGGCYVAGRAMYPFLIGPRLGRGIRSSIMLSTGIGYAVLAYFAFALVRALVAP